MSAVLVRALCLCANLLTVSARHHHRLDANRSCDDRRHPEGWRMTATLKCSVCRELTRHALLRDDSEYRDTAEQEHMKPNHPFRPRPFTEPNAAS